MPAAGIFLKLCFLLSIIAAATNLAGAGGVLKPLSTCNTTECPVYYSVDSGYGYVDDANNYELRLYDPSVWITTDPFPDTSIVNATKVLPLFKYFQGKNDQGQKIQMTAPVIVDVLQGEPSSTARFYLPKNIQANPPSAAGLSVQRRKGTAMAVRQFDGFVADYDIEAEVSKLEASVAKTAWGGQFANARDPKIRYTVAQYNSPFELSDRVNEIWIPFGI